LFDTSPNEDFGEIRRPAVLLLGATGTIGQATAKELSCQGYRVHAVVRQKKDPAHSELLQRLGNLDNVSLLVIPDIADAEAVAIPTEIDFAVSCLSSRTGSPSDAWAVDHRAHAAWLSWCVDRKVKHFVQLSAICVQKPKLAFQHAKLAFEQELERSSLPYSIVRPTAYFKSLSGQIERVKGGKPFMVFGDGQLTRCKPISDRDLARFLVACLEDSSRKNRILPIGGPGPALSPLEQAELLFGMLGQETNVQRIPPKMFTLLARLFDGLGVLIPHFRDKAEFLRTAHYYATESMLVWDQDAQVYCEDTTPSAGTDQLADHYAQLLKSGERTDLKEHAMFSA